MFRILQDYGLSLSPLSANVQIGRHENKGSVPAADVLSRLADALGVSGDFLMSGTSDQHAASQLTDHDLLARFRQVEAMPPEDRSVIKQLIDAFVAKSKIQQILS